MIFVRLLSLLDRCFISFDKYDYMKCFLLIGFFLLFVKNSSSQVQPEWVQYVTLDSPYINNSGVLDFTLDNDGNPIFLGSSKDTAANTLSYLIKYTPSG